MTLNGRRHFHDEFDEKLAGRAYIWAAAVLVFKVYLEQLRFWDSNAKTNAKIWALVNITVLSFYSRRRHWTMRGVARANKEPNDKYNIFTYVGSFFSCARVLCLRRLGSKFCSTQANLKFRSPIERCSGSHCSLLRYMMNTRGDNLDACPDRCSPLPPRLG